MSLTSYTGLLAEAALWLDRSDLTARIPSFVSLAEAEIARVLRRTTVRETVTIFEESWTIPSTIAELRSLRLVTSSRTQDTAIKIVTPEMLDDIRARSSATGRPTAAMVVGSNLIFVPTPDQLYEMEITYYEKLVPLSTDNESNSVLVEAPDAYLYGTLREAAAYLEHDERIPLWTARTASALEQLEAARAREEFGASLSPSRLPVVF